MHDGPVTHEKATSSPLADAEVGEAGWSTVAADESALSPLMEPGGRVVDSVR